VRPPLEFLIEILRGAIIKQFKKKKKKKKKKNLAEICATF
jgi:hypothetical protein